ncbi:hypothetical protein P171DRAFT_488752 [Karstenula rhodostoma CBS 690.94]|uniref:SWIM-type domain-containing protein n=1 Tax=Karstenula rhodostoma CBS 690.94 TaxID=1392251 RepID=A0A9P4PA28_9PLEO|nr:hypothetical protein P171DRAFT_488752 [Karstenula rhodostoma CBS 690.94]
MSAEELSKLSLGDTMVTTRAGAARLRTHLPQTPQGSSTSSPISPTPSLIESTNGHVYDISAFDEDMRRRAKIGLIKDDNNIRMRFCGETDDGKKFFFHVDDDITIKVEEEKVPKCSCGIVQDEKACKHIFWILGHLSSVLSKDQTIQLAEDGSSVKNTHPAKLLQMSSLRDFADHFHWVVEDEDLPDTDELIDEVANMMSCFEPTGLLPAEFKSEDTRELSDLSRKFQEIRTVIAEHAIRYPAFFMQLREKCSPTFQMEVFFEKINKRIDGAFNALDEYIERGGPTNHRTESLDVESCAARLKSLVDKIEEYRDESLVSDAGERRDDTEIEKLAAVAYVRILEEVTGRNYDAYADSPWSMPMPPSDPRRNNLFVCLIGPASEENGFFVVDKLQDMAPHVVRHHGVDLGDIENRLRNTPLTPPAYLGALRMLIQEKRKRAASQSDGSSVKRTMQ